MAVETKLFSLHLKGYESAFTFEGRQILNVEWKRQRVEYDLDVYYSVTHEAFICATGITCNGVYQCTFMTNCIYLESVKNAKLHTWPWPVSFLPKYRKSLALFYKDSLAKEYPKELLYWIAGAILAVGNCQDERLMAAVVWWLQRRGVLPTQFVEPASLPCHQEFQQ